MSTQPSQSLWPLILDIDIGPGKIDKLEIYHEDDKLVKMQVQSFIKRN
jgi:hypothetical protein